MDALKEPFGRQSVATAMRPSVQVRGKSSTGELSNTPRSENLALRMLPCGAGSRATGHTTHRPASCWDKA